MFNKNKNKNKINKIYNLLFPYNFIDNGEFSVIESLYKKNIELESEIELLKKLLNVKKITVRDELKGSYTKLVRRDNKDNKDDIIF